MKNIEPEKVKIEILKMKKVKLTDLNDALYLNDIPHNFEVLTCGRLRYFEKKFQTHFNFYKSSGKTGSNYRNEHLVSIRERIVKKYNRDFHFKILTEFPTTINGIIENFEMIIDKKMLPRTFICTKTEKCRYQTDRNDIFQDHLKICGISNVQSLFTKQLSYGLENEILREIAEFGYIPYQYIAYRSFLHITYDIETIEVCV